ncbi:MAG: HD-GYP domain-containing protein [Anaeromicrobium sp.]|jgi:HD-GYP domain-containing protein (c-di-GMP phosphodiesterase class II)|uniref:HD-GYP domain-containing protein n=1 Tax=Anaeromicrobium sp. TaxID=1929132 RepID=UPI0025D37DBC|nr:HD-GYP domain-containing protein [Anaeromicrobium sp.]MCT4593709.1 HD-GYP domain-containing protein [Anaeromicrobium sp.]
MIKLKTRFLKEDMILANNIYTENDEILLGEGIHLNQVYIDKLLELGISEVYVNIPSTEDIIVPDVIKEENRKEAHNIIRDTMKRISYNEDIRMKKIWKIVDKIIENLLSSDSIIVNLSLVRSIDDYTFTHSVNVCIYALIIGIGIGYKKEKLMDLGVGAILHDIGKMLIDPKVLNKPGKLTKDEYEYIKSHSKLGYEIVKNNKNISEASAKIILTHHERFDGEGYPFKLKGDEIREYARIVAICDVYDALTSDRAYKSKEFPHVVVEYLISMGYHQFDYELVKEFITHIPCYPIGTLLKLSTNEMGVVYEIDKEYPNRPIVKYISNGDKINLIYNPSIQIVGVLEKM